MTHTSRCGHPAGGTAQAVVTGDTSSWLEAPFILWMAHGGDAERSLASLELNLSTREGLAAGRPASRGSTSGWRAGPPGRMEEMIGRDDLPGNPGARP